MKHRVNDAKETPTKSKEETLENTKKRSRSASISRSETDIQPLKQSRGRSSTRSTSSETPAFLQGLPVRKTSESQKDVSDVGPTLCPVTGLIK